MIERKERPLCRKAIVENLKLKPHIVENTWDGHSYFDSEDNLHDYGMSDGLKRQMRKMVEEGFWGRVLTKRNR